MSTIKNLKNQKYFDNKKNVESIISSSETINSLEKTIDTLSAIVMKFECKSNNLANSLNSAYERQDIDEIKKIQESINNFNQLVKASMTLTIENFISSNTKKREPKSMGDDMGLPIEVL